MAKNFRTWPLPWKMAGASNIRVNSRRLNMFHWSVFIAVMIFWGLTPVKAFPYSVMHGHMQQIRTNSFFNKFQMNTNDDDGGKELSEEFRIRPAKFGEMGQVSQIIVSSFYNPSPLIRPYLYLNELQRLQSNFPYSDPKHHVFVASIGTTIVGFVDVDGRPSTMAKAPPRPYLSDLAVDPKYRRRGIAKALIQKCEEIVQDLMKSDELYLRVERDNQAGLSMYEGLGYDPLKHPVFGVEDTTILLKREFTQNNDEANENQKAAEDETIKNNVNFLDYVV